MNCFPNGSRKLKPTPPKKNSKNSERNKSALDFLLLDQFLNQSKNEHCGEENRERTNQRNSHSQHKSRPQGNFWLRRGKITTSALGTNFGSPGIRVRARTEFHVVTATAIITVERLADGDSIT